MSDSDQKRNLASRFVKGFAANGFGQAVTLLTSLLLVPLSMNAWGLQLYGEWLSLSAIPVYLTMSDLSFGTTAGSEMTMLAAQGETRKALSVLQSAWILVTVASVGILALMLVAARLVDIPALLHLSVFSNQEARGIMTVLLLGVCLSQQGGLLDAVFKCAGLYARGLMMQNTLRLVELIGFVAVLLTNRDPWLFAVVMIVPKAVFYVAMWSFLRKRAPDYYLGWSHADMKLMKPMFVPALTFNSFNLGYAMNLQGIVVLLSIRATPIQVALFNPLRTLTRMIVQVSSMIGNTAWAEFSRAVGSGDLELARRIHRRATQLSFWAAVPLQIGLLVFGPWLFKVWTGQTLSDYRVLASLVLLTVLTSVWNIAWVVPMSTNRHQTTAVFFLASSLGVLALAGWLIGPLGAFGACLAVVVGEAAMLLFVVPKALGLLHDDLKPYLVQLFTPPIDLVGRYLQRARARSGRNGGSGEAGQT